MTTNVPSRGGGGKHPDTLTMTRSDWLAAGEALRDGLRFWQGLLAVECQRARVRRTRRRFPDVTAAMTDTDVWELCRRSDR